MPQSKFNLLRADDLGRDNEVFVISNASTAQLAGLAGIAWIRECQVDERRSAVHREALGHAIPIVIEQCTAELWLLATQPGWSPANRVTRYRSLWDSFRAISKTRLAKYETPESSLETEHGLKKCGAVRVSAGDLDWALGILGDSPSSHLVAFPNSARELLTPLIQSNWDDEYRYPNSHILHTVTSHDGVVFLPIGHFDDREAGVALFAKRSIIESLHRAAET